MRGEDRTQTQACVSARLFLPLCCPGGLDWLGPSITKLGIPCTGKVGRLRPEPWLQSPGMTLARTSSKLKMGLKSLGPSEESETWWAHAVGGSCVPPSPCEPASGPSSLRGKQGALLPAVVATFSSTNWYRAMTLLTCACPYRRPVECVLSIH